MWLARDKNNMLFLYEGKPYKCSIGWLKGDSKYSYSGINPELFPEVKWEDSEPTKVKLIIKKK